MTVTIQRSFADWPGVEAELIRMVRHGTPDVQLRATRLLEKLWGEQLLPPGLRNSDPEVPA